MMLTIKLHPEVVRFLRETSTTWYYDDQETFVVNNSWYKPTDKENVYTVKFLKVEKPNGQ